MRGGGEGQRERERRRLCAGKERARELAQRAAQRPLKTQNAGNGWPWNRGYRILCQTAPVHGGAPCTQRSCLLCRTASRLGPLQHTKGRPIGVKRATLDRGAHVAQECQERVGVVAERRRWTVTATHTRRHGRKKPMPRRRTEKHVPTCPPTHGTAGHVNAWRRARAQNTPYLSSRTDARSSWVWSKCEM